MSACARATLWLALVAAAAPAPASPTEWWVIAARFESGDALLFELTRTDVGPGARNAAAIGHWVAADGALTPFRKAKRGGDWRESAGGRRIDLEKVAFDRSGATARVTVAKKSLRLALDFPLAAMPLRATRFAGGAWTQELWSAGAPAEVTFWQRGRGELRTRGLAAVSHRSVAGAEGALAGRRLEAFSLARGARLYVAELAGAGGTERWVVGVRDGAVFAEARETLAAETPLAREPRRIALGAEAARGELRAGRTLVAYDPLADLPTPVRLLVALSVRMRSAWLASPLDVTLRGEGRGLRLRGTALASYTFYGEP